LPFPRTDLSRDFRAGHAACGEASGKTARASYVARFARLGIHLANPARQSGCKSIPTPPPPPETRLHDKEPAGRYRSVEAPWRADDPVRCRHGQGGRAGRQARASVRQQRRGGSGNCPRGGQRTRRAPGIGGCERRVRHGLESVAGIARGRERPDRNSGAGCFSGPVPGLTDRLETLLRGTNGAPPWPPPVLAHGRG
jgi:hypothetical protein